MKKGFIIFFMFFLVVLIGCNNSSGEELTEDEAEQIIIDERSRECCGDAEIISIVSKSDKYVITWQIESIHEGGTDSVIKKSGKVKTIESTRGACKLK